ncbi:MAG: FmdB family zinc ribbon protein, partial [Elusimicrobiota bacterium]
MPIFEYRCNECNEAFEVLKLSSKDNHTTCASCGSERVHRIISSVGIIFKGSGFYVTDSKKNSTID